MTQSEEILYNSNLDWMIDINKTLETYDIGLVLAERTENSKTKEVKISNFYIFLMYKKTGFFSQRVLTINYMNSRKAYNLLYSYMFTDEWLSQDCYMFRGIGGKPFTGCKSTLFIKKNPEIKIQNKLKLSFDVFKSYMSNDIEATYHSYFEISMKNFNTYAIYIPVEESLEFFTNFDNKEIKTPAIMFEKEIQKEIDDVNKIIKRHNELINNTNKQLVTAKKDYESLEKIKNNTVDIKNKINVLFTQEEIDSQRLLKEMKKFGG